MIGSTTLKIFDNYDGRIMSGILFNNILKDNGLRMYKILNNDMTYHGMSHKIGMNIDYYKHYPYELVRDLKYENKFVAYTYCLTGGFDFYFQDSLHYDKYAVAEKRQIYKVRLPNDTFITINNSKFKSEKIFISRLEEEDREILRKNNVFVEDNFK